MHDERRPRFARPALLVILMLLAINCVSCSGTPNSLSGGAAESGGTVMDKEARFDGLQKTACPDKKPVDQNIYDDTSLSSEGLASARLPIILANARITAICGGRLRILTFSKSISQVRPIFDQELDPGSGTYISQVLKADAAVETVERSIAPILAAATTYQDGTDLAAVLQDAAEEHAELEGRSSHFRVLVITDGEATVGERVSKSTTTAQAKALAARGSVPDLSGVQVVFTGIGLFGSKQQSTTAQTGSLKAFLQVICNRATRSTCAAPTTNYTN